MPENLPEDPPFVSYAQNREDVVLWRALQHVTPGRYVDVGAADPVQDSVTLALYERGWRGINIEPVPQYADALRSARPGDVVVECGIGSAPGSATLAVFEGTGLSTFDARAADRARTRGYAVREATVPVRTLDDVLSEHLDGDSPIHVLKVDVEGFELDVLQGAKLERWQPWVLVIEATEPGSARPSYSQWESLVEGAGYRLCLFDGLNRFYLHTDRPELEAALSYPACVLDHPFELWHDVQLRREWRRQLDESRSEVERRQVALEEAMAGLEGLQSEHDGLARKHDALARNHDALLQAHRSAFRNHEELGRAHRALAQGHEALLQAHHAVVMDRDALARAHRGAVDHAEHLQAAYNLALSSVSWRVTAPLRAVRGLPRLGVRGSTRGERPDEHQLTRPDDQSGDASSKAREIADDQATAFRRRLRQGAAILTGRADADPTAREPRESMALFVDALASADTDSIASAWLSYVVATASYPDESTLRTEDRLLRRLGAREYGEHLNELFAEAVDVGRVKPVDLDPVADAICVDVTHTAQHDLQTGIQRVVRETCSRWLSNERMVPVWWDYSSNALRRLGKDDVARFRAWRQRLSTSSQAGPGVHPLEDGPTAIVVPWRSQIVLPELAAEPERTEGYRSLACSGVIRRLSVIGYDVIPMTAAETVTEGMSHRFSLYLSMVKRSDRLAAISAAAAEDFRAFNGALASQGLTGPIVEAHLLPPSPAPVDQATLVSVRGQLGLGESPMVLVVGSHEPRKNHLVVLEAAELLWASGVSFDLVFIGGSGWRSEPFALEAERLQAVGRPVQVRRGASEPELWAAYRLARFSVFPSLVEGYGLPIVESIASGTPVITTNYGSMAEVGAGGGAVLIDPYDAQMLADQMRRLLLDDVELEQLRAEAALRQFPSWDDYAESVWRFFVEDDRAG